MVFSTAAGGNNQNVLAGRRFDVPAQDLKHDVEFMLPDHELRSDLVIGLERPWIELADRLT